MLRQGFMRKYRVKSSYDNDRFQKEDEGYLLKLSRPIKASSIKSLSKEKLNKFIEDVLLNRKITSILYDSNAKIEIESSLRLIKNFNIQNKKYENLKREKIESSVVKKRSRKEAYIQMKTEINEHESKKRRYINNLLRKNFKKYLEMKKDLKISQNDYINNLKKNRIESFRRAYEDIISKIDDNKGKTVETDYENYEVTPESKKLENYFLFRNNFINCKRTINIPKIRFNMKNVYSRLYNNKVLLTSNTEKNIKKSSFFISKRRRIYSKERMMTLISSQNMPHSMTKNRFTIKNVIKANGGKEFTVKVTNEMFKKCLDKYSGGPETIPNLKEDINNLIQEKKLNIESFVDFYKLVEKNTGNSYLHLATEGNYNQLVKYFINKGSDINLQNAEGNTPMHIAAKNKNMKIIKILLDHKAKLDIPNKEGEIPFDLFTFDMKKKFGLETRLIINPTKG